MKQGGRWVVHAAGDARWERFLLAEPGAGQILLRTEASLVSAGTELAIYAGIHQGLTNPLVNWPTYPQPMGYMAVARVEKVGPGVADVRPDDRLLTSTGHASHVLLPAEAARSRCWLLPEEGPAHRLVFARMAKTAVTAACQVGTTLAQSTVVVGLGIIGQMALRLFVAAGAWPVFGVDPVAFRRSAALRGGAAAAFDASGDELVGQLRSRLPAGTDIVVDCTGWAAALPGVMRLAREGGTVVVLGSPRGTAPDVDFYSDLHRRSLRVVGAHDSGIGTEVRERFPWTNDRMVPVVIDWVRTGRLPVEDLVSHRVSPTALPEMYRGLLEEKERFLGVVLDWAKEA